MGYVSFFLSLRLSLSHLKKIYKKQEPPPYVLFEREVQENNPTFSCFHENLNCITHLYHKKITRTPNHARTQVHSMGFSSGGMYKLRTELAEIEMERLREDQDRLRCEDAIKMEKRLSIRLRKEIQEREFALSVERNAYDNVDKNQTSAQETLKKKIESMEAKLLETNANLLSTNRRLQLRESELKRLVESTDDMFRRREDLKLTIQDRLDAAVSQGITAATLAFSHHLEENIGDKAALERLTRLGLLLQQENLLSSNAKDKGMTNDQLTVTSALQLVAFRVVRSDGKVRVDDDEEEKKVSFENNEGETSETVRISLFHQ